MEKCGSVGMVLMYRPTPSKKKDQKKNIEAKKSPEEK
jgi:hypothetical protein